MAVCTYDNPATMARECWADEKLVCSYPFHTMPCFTGKPIPAYRFFFGANIGPWKKGQINGDPAAITKEHRPETTLAG